MAYFDLSKLNLTESKS